MRILSNKARVFLAKFLLIFPFSSHATSSPQFLSDEKAPLVLGVGEQRLLKIDHLARYSLGSKVVRVLPRTHPIYQSRNRQDLLLIKAVSPGQGDLWVWKTDGSSEHRSIRVEKWARDGKTSSLEKALGRLQEVEVISTGKGVLLRGVVRTIEESSIIYALLKTYPNEIINSSELSPDLREKGAVALEKWITSVGLQNSLRIEHIGNELWVRGNLEHSSQQSSIEKELHKIFPLLQTEIESLPNLSPTIHFRVFLLELKRSFFKSIGVSWSSQQIQAFSMNSRGSQDLTQVDLTLHHLEGNGQLKILSNPELVVRAPGEAELFAGGELPLQVHTRYYSNVSWKNYGLTLRLKVTHIAGNRVRLDIFTEVSHLDTGAGQDKVPGIQVNRLKTQVDARFSTPLFLSGLLQQGIREEARGLPFLRQIPVLGPLFGSDDFLNERSELVAILYPYASPPTQLNRRILNGIPQGPLPPPRQWLDPKEEKALTESENYPWNALD